MTGCFKFRGAYVAVKNLKDKHDEVVSYSLGNHALAVALSAKYNDMKSTIFMPTDAT